MVLYDDLRKCKHCGHAIRATTDGMGWFHIHRTGIHMGDKAEPED